MLIPCSICRTHFHALPHIQGMPGGLTHPQWACGHFKGAPVSKELVNDPWVVLSSYELVCSSLHVLVDVLQAVVALVAELGLLLQSIIMQLYLLGLPQTVLIE